MSSYTEKYMIAIYKSGREDLISNLEETVGYQIGQLPYQYLTLNAAIRAIKQSVLTIKFVRRELQEDPKFISVFVDELSNIKIAVDGTSNTNINSIFLVFRESIRRDYISTILRYCDEFIFSEDIKLFIALNF